MCGIIAYTGKQNKVGECLKILESLQYRGRDGAGISINGTITRVVGSPEDLIEKIEVVKHTDSAYSLIAHTRWATHGRKDFLDNAHPHTDSSKRFIVVHNGMISNAEKLKQELLSDYLFYSETDTEIIPALLSKFATEHPDNSTEQHIKQILELISGTYGFVIEDRTNPGVLYAIRSGSPLSIGKSTDGIYICSDETKLHKYTDTIVTLDIGDLCIANPNGFTITNISTGDVRTPEERMTNPDQEEADKGSYTYWTEKELMETPDRLLDTMRGRIDAVGGNAILNGISQIADKLPLVKNVILIGCGTSRNAGMYGKMMIEKYAGIPCEIIDASVFAEINPIITPETLIIPISQSGETADVIHALTEAKNHGAVLLGIINAVDSTIARMCGHGVYIQVGPEIGVASTKAFFGQCSILVMIAIALGRTRALSAADASELLEGLATIPEMLTTIIERRDSIKELAVTTINRHHMLISSNTGWAGICEAKLKMEELCYDPVSAELGGSLKHGPLAMISHENKNVVIACLTGHPDGDKRIRDTVAITLSNGAEPIIIAPENIDPGSYSNGEPILIPTPEIHSDLSIFTSTYVLQWYVYYMSTLLGNNPDYPRNLAKSVTV
jgi:glucosamine--fructose-6-phosphate aminotransferase (isomerizing)